VLAYDGTRYQGFQRQAGETPTIQLAVEQALAQVTQQVVGVIGAGRTDAGVHARGQVIAFDVAWPHPDADLLRALNAVLPDDIALQSLERAAGFHPRYDARSRVYSYTVLHVTARQPLRRHTAWQVWGDLDRAVLAETAHLLLGEHDFATFGNPPQGTNTVRCLYQSTWTVTPEVFGARLVYLVEGTAFLYHMVRRIVGMQLDVARGLSTLAEFEQAFRAADIALAGTVAPPQGLVLELVRY
jgi:tRNA pseudouridine38-40 synthase